LGATSLTISQVEIGKNANDEFLIIHNTADNDIDLESLPFKLHIINSSGSDTNKILTFKNSIIMAKGSFFIAPKTYTGSEIPDATYSSSSNSLVKNGAVYISTNATDNTDILDYVYCTDGYPHKTIPEPEPEPPKIYTDKIYLNELLPAPGKDREEYIELYNPTDESVDLAGWILRDNSKSGKYIFPENSIINSLDYLVIYQEDLKFALNNSGGEAVNLYDPNENLVSSVTYNSSFTDVSYNFNGSIWRWSKLLTPGAPNQFNNLPDIKTKNPIKAYVNTYVSFEASGKDSDKDKLKYTWDFGDGHKSYKQNPEHKFEKTGNYAIRLKIFDGSEEVIENFTIDISKFPKNKIKIIGLSPNPKGTDSKNEYIVLQNKSKKKVNLKDWSIATGSNSKKMTNHPISESLTLKPGEKIKLTRDYSKFTLNNKKAKVELRYPDGEVADKTKYNKKDATVEEDELLVLADKKWDWVEPERALLDDTENLVNTDNILNVAETSPTVENKILEDQPEQETILETENKENEKIIPENMPEINNLLEENGEVLGLEIMRSNDNKSPLKMNQPGVLNRFFTLFNSWINKIIF
jgi:hypothetical protein